MRVIAGRLKGRQFASPGGHRTHPMSDKMRGALFSVLGDIEGLKVLDVYAGSGALGIEALSRGAASVYAIDSDRRAQQTIMSNSQLLGLSGALHIGKMNLSSWLNSKSGVRFDLIMADPPYDRLSVKDISQLPFYLVPGGTLVLSWPGRQELPALEDMACLEVKDYGDGQLAFYK